MPLRVGFDLDGTVADMYTALRREAVSLFGEDVLATPTAPQSRSQASTPRNTKPADESKPKSEDDQTTTLAMRSEEHTSELQSH